LLLRIIADLKLPERGGRSSDSPKLWAFGAGGFVTEVKAVGTGVEMGWQKKDGL
jgi:hypothetical protein